MLVVWLGSPIRNQPMEWARTDLPITKEPLNNEPLPSTPLPPIEKKGPTVPVPTPTPIQVPDRVPVPTSVPDRDRKQVPNPDPAPAKEKVSEPVVSKKDVSIVKQNQMTEFEQIAFEFLKPRLGDSINEFQSFVSPKRKETGSVVYYRMVHDTPILDQNINLTINSKTQDVYSTIEGNITEAIDPLHFPLPHDVLSKTNANEILGKEMRLVYLQTGENQYELVYQPAVYGYIDAKSGEWLDSSYKQLSKSSGVTVFLDPKELFSVKSEEEVSTILSNFFTLDTNPILLQNGSTFKENRMYQWEDQVGRKGYIGVDWISGQLLEYSYDPGANSTSAKINKVEAQQKAITLLEHVFPSQIKELYLDISKEMTNTSSITFTFYPSYDGIPVISYPYLVTVDMDTGAVTKYEGSSFRPELLPKKSGILSVKEATDAYIQAYPFHLVYILPTSNGAPRLVYSPLPAYISTSSIDAKTGLLLLE